MKRTLEITLELTSDNTFNVEIHEPESGDSVCIECHDEGMSVSGENEKIMEEIRSWVEFIREEENFIRKNEG